MAQNTSTRGAARAQEPTVGPWLAYRLGRTNRATSTGTLLAERTELENHRAPRGLPDGGHRNPSQHDNSRTPDRRPTQPCKFSAVMCACTRTAKNSTYRRAGCWWWIRRFRTIFTLSRTVRFCSLLRGRMVSVRRQEEVCGFERFHTSDDYVLMLSRLVLGIIFLAHGAQKVFGWFGGPGFDQTMKEFMPGHGNSCVFCGDGDPGGISGRHRTAGRVYSAASQRSA